MNQLRKEAKNVAEALLDVTGNTSAPIQLNKIIDWIEKNFGFEIKVQTSTTLLTEHGASGKMYREGERAFILINADDSPARQRFTLGHEIGHIVEALEKASMTTLLPTKYDGERFADMFSAELNMPEQLIREQWKKISGTFTPAVVQYKLARTFQVSNEAMGYRLNELGIQGGHWSGQSTPPVYTR